MTTATFHGTYVGWDVTITHHRSQIVNELLLHAHQSKASDVVEPFNGDSVQPQSEGARRLPEDTHDEPDIETELSDEISLESTELKELCLPLEIDRRCNLCAIVAICSKRDSRQRWLLDYSLLCYKCTAAPRTSMSTLIVATEFLHLLQLHFRDINFEHIFRDKIISIFDFHTHFFINKCYTARDDDPIHCENVTLGHMSVVRSILMRDEVVPYTKQKRNTYKLPKKKFQTDGDDTDIYNFIKQHGMIVKDRFVDTLFYIWSGTNVFFNTTLTDIAIKKQKRLKEYRSRTTEIEPCIGPIYLSHTPIFNIKNHTTTVCLLCELMACSFYDNHVLQELHRKILNYCHNNLKIIDRIQLALADLMSFSTNSSVIPARIRTNQDISEYLSESSEPWFSAAPGTSDNSSLELDAPLYFILKQVGVTGIYKHFFCDPICAANIRSTKPDILFSRTPAEYLGELKLMICCANNYVTHVTRDFWLYAQIFKAFQNIKRNYKAKTQLSDFLRDFKQVLENHNFQLIDPDFIIDKYV
nr:MAG: protein m52 [Herpesviridae sp.]